MRRKQPPYYAIAHGLLAIPILRWSFAGDPAPARTENDRAARQEPKEIKWIPPVARPEGELEQDR
jgi:hypothetical protein